MSALMKTIAVIALVNCLLVPSPQHDTEKQNTQNNYIIKKKKKVNSKHTVFLISQVGNFVRFKLFSSVSSITEAKTVSVLAKHKSSHVLVFLSVSDGDMGHH